MKRVLATLALVSAALLAHVLLTPASSSAQEDDPENFLSSLNCYRQADAQGTLGPPLVAASFWIPSDEQTGLALSVDEVWIDLSLFNNNFAAGTFIGAGPFEVEDGTTQFDWSGLLPDRRHHYRLNALTDAGWREIGRGVFDTPDCNTVGSMRCDFADDNTLSVLFLLRQAPILEGGRPVEQWIDISLFNNNFARGTFLGAGPFAADAGTVSPPQLPLSFQWSGILAGRVHYWRTNVLYDPSVWIVNLRGSFLTPDCRGLPSPAPPPLT